MFDFEILQIGRLHFRVVNGFRIQTLPCDLSVLRYVIEVLSCAHVIWTVICDLLQNRLDFTVGHLILLNFIHSYQPLHLKILSQLFIVQPEFN